MLGKPSRRTRRKLEDHGATAPAVVLEIADGGMAVTNGAEGVVANTELIVKTRLRVEPEGAEPFEVHQRFRYPQLSVPSVGTRLTVRFDPKDHDTVMIDRTASSATGLHGEDLGGILATVRKAQADGGGNPQAVAEALRGAFGADGTVVVDARNLAGANPDDPIDHLQRLVALRDSGVLTAAEFETQKQRLLDLGL
jgi:hypothetical protein